jgi:hypothetical protein
VRDKRFRHRGNPERRIQRRRTINLPARFDGQVEEDRQLSPEEMRRRGLPDHIFLDDRELDIPQL